MNRAVTKLEVDVMNHLNLNGMTELPHSEPGDTFTLQPFEYDGNQFTGFGMERNK